MLNRKKIVFFVIISTLIAMWAGSDMLAQYVTSTLPPPPPPPDTRPSVQQQQSPKLDLHFNVKPTVPRTYDDVQGLGEYAADLKNPSNITSEIEFDPETGCYVIHTRLGDYDIVTPFIMSADEFSNTDFRRSMMEYYRQKNAESAQDKEQDPFNFLDMQFGMGPLETVFGPGGLQLKTTGSVIINMGVKSNSTDNPSLSVSQRKKTYFDFEQKIQANINATHLLRLPFCKSCPNVLTFFCTAQPHFKHTACLSSNSAPQLLQKGRPDERHDRYKPDGHAGIPAGQCNIPSRVCKDQKGS